MNKEKLFEILKRLTDKLQDLKLNGTVKLSNEEATELKTVYNIIYPTVPVNMGCPACVKQYLYFLQSYYEREFTLYEQSLAAQQPLETSESNKHKGKRKKG